MAHIHVVLLEPEIPQNTGNIARTCAATGSSLHLIEPLGFKIDDRSLRRAGLDYWDKLDVHVYENIEDFYKKNPGADIYYFSKKAHHVYTDVAYPKEVYLMFGKETKGIPRMSSAGTKRKPCGCRCAKGCVLLIYQTRSRSPYTRYCDNMISSIWRWKDYYKNRLKRFFHNL